MHGYKALSDEDRRNLSVMEMPEAEGRELQSMSTIDWSVSNMTPVKNQGQCGSCWSFAATSVLEGMVSVQNNSTAVRLSEQEGVDCVTSSNGCYGGHMYYYWQMSGQRGSQSSAAYPYRTVQGACKTGTPIAQANFNTTWALGSGATVASIYAALQNGPMAVAVNASGRAFQDYSSGALSDDAALCDPNALDHAVTLVGYIEGAETVEEVTTTTPGTETTTCSKASRREKRARSCNGVDEWYNSDSRKCCITTTTKGTSTTETITTQTGALWKVQNSWSDMWGDEGFFYVPVAEGAGACGMNRDVWGVTAM